MSPPEFELQFAKAKKKWPKYFTNEMEDQVFNICKSVSGDFFSRKISEIVWNVQPPKIDWFHAIVSNYRNRQEVKSSIDQMHPAEDSSLDSDTISMMKEYCNRRIDGKLTDKAYHDFQKTLVEMIGARPDIKCKTCLDHGFYLPYLEQHLVKCKNGCQQNFYGSKANT